MAHLHTSFSIMLLVVLLVSAGALCKKLRLISDTGEQELNNLLTDFLWPAQIFASICSLDRNTILTNWPLPICALITIFTGYLLALVAAGTLRFDGDRRKMFVYNGAINNFVFLPLPFVDMLLPGKGPGLLFVHNLAYIVALWTLGVAVLSGGSSGKSAWKNMLTPALVSTAVALAFVLSGTAAFVPAQVLKAAELLGRAVVPLSMVVVGSQIYRMGVSSLRFDLWNMSTGILRLVIVPALLLLPAMWLAKNTGFSHEMLLVFMIVNLMPVSLASVGLAKRYGGSVELAAQGVVFTHLFSIATVPLFLALVGRLIAK